MQFIDQVDKETLSI